MFTVHLEEGGCAEVGAVEVVPLLPLGEHDGAQRQVEEHHPHARRARDQHLRHTSTTAGVNKCKIGTPSPGTVIFREMPLKALSTHLIGQYVGRMRNIDIRYLLYLFLSLFQSNLKL